MSANRSFKTTERAIARRLGGKRLGHLGGADVTTDWLCVECKHRQSIPAWLVDAIAQAKRNATADQLPVAIIHQHGAHHADDLVVLTFAHFQEWFGGPS